MHAFLITGDNKTKVEEEVKKIADKETSQLLYSNIEKISDVRELSSICKLKSTQKSAFFVGNLENSSIEALNAFLKLLEEPQENVTFILSANSENSVLPTVLSRCQVIRLNKASKELSDEDKRQLNIFLKNNKLENLMEIEKYKKREDALYFLSNLLVFLHQQIKMDKANYKLALKTKKVQSTYRNIQKNGNTFIQLVDFVANS